MKYTIEEQLGMDSYEKHMKIANAMITKLKSMERKYGVVHTKTMDYRKEYNMIHVVMGKLHEEVYTPELVQKIMINYDISVLREDRNKKLNELGI